MNSTTYLASDFPGLVLKPGLFYEWQPAIRFELGDPKEQDESTYIAGSYDRAITLFKALHAPEDDCIVVMDAFEGDLKRRNLSPFLLNKERFRIVATSYVEDDATFIRFEIARKVQDIAYFKLIRAIVHADLGVKPNIPHRVYVLNMRTQTIFHVYDDRGCDVLASRVETLKPLYKQFSNWILDYDRDAIDRVFE